MKNILYHKKLVFNDEGMPEWRLVMGKNPNMHGICDYVYGDCTNIRGNCSMIIGDVTGLTGSCSTIKGDVTGIAWNLDNEDEPYERVRQLKIMMEELRIENEKNTDKE